MKISLENFFYFAKKNTSDAQWLYVKKLKEVFGKWQTGEVLGPEKKLRHLLVRAKILQLVMLTDSFLLVLKSADCVSCFCPNIPAIVN